MTDLKKLARDLIEGPCPHPTKQQVVLSNGRLCLACGLVLP